MSIFTDIGKNFDYAVALAPVAVTTTQTSSAIDLNGAMDVLVLVEAGAGTINSTDKLTFTCTEGATSAAADACASGQYSGVDSWDLALDITGDKNKFYQFQFKPTQRYMKVVATVAGSFSAIVGIHVMFTKRNQPASA
jgi:hypothetical protein